jgi:formylglycine-generating enzyme required for sulfatase activity
VPDTWREALRLLVSMCKDDDVDAVLLSILNPCPGEAVANTLGLRAILATQCLAEEPNVGADTALEVLKRFVSAIGEEDGVAAIRSTIEKVALEVWRSHPDHRDALQACLLEAFAEPANSMGRNCGAVLAQLLGSTTPITVDWLEESLETARAKLGSPSDAEAIMAALQVLELAYQGWSLHGEGVEEKLLALLGRGGAPAHAAAWALAWLSVDRVSATASNLPFIRYRFFPPLSDQHHGLPTAIGWRPSELAATELVRALEQARVDEVRLKRYLIGLLGLASHADVLPPLLVRLDEPDATVRRAVQIALASLANCGMPLSASLGSELEATLIDRLLHNETLEETECVDALVLLALFDREEPLRQLLFDDKSPLLFRRGVVECLGLLASRCGVRERRQCIETFLAEQLRADGLGLLVTDEEGWAEHDRLLPLLQGASRGLQLAASADLPLLGSGPGRKVPMLTLTALQEGEGLRIRTEVVRPAVWKLPLPGGEQLELVMVEGREYTIGSPEEEAGRDLYPRFRQKCEGVNVEAQRPVNLKAFALVRHPLTQAQWQAVARLPRQERDLNPTPGTYKPDDLWERFAQPGALPVDSVSWNDCQEWLRRLNRWLVEHWPKLGGQGEAPQLALPSESQWEAACRAGSGTPFHFGDTLDATWANVDGNYTYGAGRTGAYRQRPVPVGFFGLVNRWGLAEMHGQLLEWCGDHWHRDPRAGSMADGSPVDELDPDLEGNQEQNYRLLRGGSWFSAPLNCRAAFRGSSIPANVNTIFGVRPCCLLPPGSLLGS